MSITNFPFIGKQYKVISGVHNGFCGECVSYDLDSKLPVILQDKNWNTKAVKVDEIEEYKSNRIDINQEQKN